MNSYEGCLPVGAGVGPGVQALMDAEDSLPFVYGEKRDSREDQLLAPVMGEVLPHTWEDMADRL